ncbi:MAG TPA: hypothetical protein VLB72_07895 [Burkholderiales bacterium]|nr:hypothetical protein [Burkholderiales bacterium]
MKLRGRSLLPLLALLCAPPAIHAGAVDIAAAVGFTDTYQPGRWTPLSVTVTNHGGDLSGELEVQVSGGDELYNRLFETIHRRKLELHRDSRKTLQFTVFLQGLSHPPVIRVRSGERELARAEVDLRTRFAAERLLLVLSRDADLDYLNDGTANGLRVLYPHPELLPVHWRGYDAVAAIVVHGLSMERLSAIQFDALHKWIAQGGILAVSGGPDYALLRSTRLAALLPGRPLGLMRVNPSDLQRAFSASLDVSRPVHVNRLDSYRGRASLRAGAVPLIVERALGLGRVLYLTFDVAGYPFNRWDGMRRLWLESLRLPPAPEFSLSATEPALASPLMPLIRAGVTNFPSHATVFYFLALYLGLLLAGYGLSARQTRRRWLATLWSWAAPVLFTAAAWLLFGPTVFPRGATAVAAALIEPFPDSIYARLALDVGVYSNRSGALHLEYRGAEPVLYPTRQVQRDGSVENWVFGEGPQRFLEPLDRRRYVLHALEGEDVITFNLDASLHDEATGLQLVLDNGSGRTLKDLWLVFDGYAYELGSVEAGARVERKFVRRTHGLEVGEAPWKHVLKPHSGVPAQAMEPTRILLERKSREMRESGYPRRGHALLIGYTENPFRPAGSSADWPRREHALVAFQVPAKPGNAPAGKTATGR